MLSMKTLSKSVSKLVKKFSKRAKKTWCAVVAFFQPRATQRLSAKTKRIYMISHLLMRSRPFVDKCKH